MKKTFVYSEFGGVPSSSDGGSSAAGEPQAMKAAWISVQAEKNDERQLPLLCDGLFPLFLSHCPSSKAPLYRQVFGDGKSLMLVLCRQLCRVARLALRAGFPANMAASRALHDDPRHMALVSFLSVLCDPSFFEGIVEQGHYESLLDVAALHNLPSMLAALHGSFLECIAASPAAGVAPAAASDVSPLAVSVEQKHLALLASVVSQPHSAALVKDLHHSNSVASGIMHTFHVCLRHPFYASSSISALAGELMKQLLKPAARGIVFPARKVADACEKAIAAALAAEAEGTDDNLLADDPALNSQKFVTLSHCLTLLLGLRMAFGSPAQEHFDFGTLFTVILSLQQAMGLQRRTAELLADNVLAFATLPAYSAVLDQWVLVPGGSGSSGGGNKDHHQHAPTLEAKKTSFFASYLPAPLAKMLSAPTLAVAAASDGAGHAPVVFPAPLESAASFLCTAVNADAKMVVAIRLFAALLKASAADNASAAVAVRVFATAAEGGLSTMDVGLLSVFLRAVDEMARVVDASHLLRVIAERLELATLPPAHIEKLLIFFAALAQGGGQAARHVVGSGALERSSALLERINSDSDLLVRDSLVASIKCLWLAVLVVPGSVEVFELCDSPRVCLQTLTAPRPDGRVVAAAAHARMMLVALVATNNDFVECLVALLLQYSGRALWDPRTSDLLATFAIVVFEAKCHEEAVRKNGIEVLLSLLHSVEFGTTHAVDIKLICTGLSLILPTVRWSEVGRMLAVAIPQSLKSTAPMCQGLIDLCTGYLRSDENISHIYQFLSAVDSDRALLQFSRLHHMKVGGGVEGQSTVLLPSRSFFAETVFPLLELCAWQLAAGGSAASGTTAPTDQLPPSRPLTNAIAPAVLLEITAALAAAVGTAVMDPSFAAFVVGRRQLQLLPHVANVCPAVQHFIGPLGGSDAGPPDDSLEAQILALQRRVELWTAALAPRPSPLAHAIEFPGCGGAFGQVDVSSSADGWPSADGYSAALWVCWQRRRSPSSKFTIPLWSLSWQASDPSSLVCRLSLRIDLVRQMTVYQVVFAGQEGSLEFPLIPPNVWTHVVISHTRNKLFPSEVTVFMDGAVAKKAQLFYPMTAVTKAAAAIVPCRTVSCTLGFDGSRGVAATGGDGVECSLRVGPFQLYNAPCSLLAAVALCTTPNHAVHTGQWGAAGPSATSMLAAVLSPTAVAVLAALHASDALDAAIDDGGMPDALPPANVLVSLHPQAALLVDAAFRYLDNKEWAMTNLAQPAAASSFLLQGLYSEPTCAVVDPSFALAARGATDEWRRWADILATAADALPCDHPALVAAASGFLGVVAAVSAAVSIAELRQRPFFFWVFGLVSRRPRLFIHRGNVAQVTALFCTAPSSPAVEPHALLLTNLAMAEMLLLHLELVANLDDGAVAYLLQTAATLLSPGNPFARLNALRMQAAGFVSGFVCGMHRGFLGLHVLSRAVEVVELFLRALQLEGNAAAACDVMSAIALSVPLHGDDAAVGTRLSSQLAVAAPAYIATVRNMLLRAVGSLVQSTPPGKRQERYMAQVASAIPMAWLVIVTDRFSHSITVVLTLQLLLTLLHHHAPFRYRAHKENMWKVLCNGLQHFSHHRDIMALLLHGFLGHAKNPTVYSSALIDEQLAPTDKQSPQLLHVVFHMLKMNVVSARSAEDVVKATEAVEDVQLTAYLSQMQRQVVRAATRRQHRQLLGIVTAVRAVRRMRGLAAARSSSSSAAQADGASSPFPAAPAVSNTSATSPLQQRRRAAPSALALDELCMQRRELASRVAMYIAAVMGRYDSIVSAVYTEKDTVACVDTVSWMVVCAIGDSYQQQQEQQLASPGLRGSASTAGEGYVSESDDGDDGEGLGMSADRAAGGTFGDARGLACLSCGLDDPQPAQYNALFQSCAAIYASLIEYTSNTYQSIHVGSIKSSAFAMLLHRVLHTAPQGIGHHAEAWLSGRVIGLWLTLTGAALARTGPTVNASHRLKNALSLAQYVADRLVSGLPTPPGATLDFIAHLIPLLTSSHDQKHCKGLLMDATLFIAGPGFHSNDVARMAMARETLLKAAGTVVPLLMAGFSSGQLRLLCLRFTLLTFHALNDQDDVDRPVGQRLGDLWLLLATLAKTHCSSLMQDTFTDGAARPKTDFLHGGFDVLFQRIGAKEMFLAWFVDMRYSIQQFAQRQLDAAKEKLLSTHPKKHVKWARKYQAEHAMEKAKLEQKSDESTGEASAVISKLFALETFIDSRLLRPVAAAARAVPAHVHDDACGPGDVSVAHVAGIGSPVIHRRVFPNAAAVHNRHIELAGQPLGAFIVAPPVFGVTLCVADAAAAAAAASPSASCRLSPEARDIAQRLLAAPGSDILYVGNAYYVVGTESIVCAILLARNEIVLVSNGQFRPNGAFVVAPLRPHAAAAKQQQSRRAQVQDALSRFLPAAPVQAVFNAESVATFRHSQYFRQLRIEAQAKELVSFVWRIPLKSVLTVHERRFQHHAVALEFSSEHANNAMLVIVDSELTMSKAERAKFVEQLLPLLPAHATFETNAMKKLKLAGMQKRWLRRQISNFEYLAVANDTASRTCADLSQYPVYPWVVSQYDELLLDLDDERNYRDLGTPLGALRPQSAQQVKARFDEWPDEAQPPFHYGTHYSTSAIAMYFLVRLQPYTQLSIRYQGGRLDVADRLFHSIQEAWASSTTGSSDVKELIPELYTTAAFALHTNGTPLGTRYDGTTLHDVALPPWSCGNADIFVTVLRDALEREPVSNTLHLWADLIFGVKQRGDEAAKALNVFHHLSYDDGLEQAMAAATTEEDRKAIVASLDNFGLTPKLVFLTPHPKRLSLGEAPPSRTQQFTHAFPQFQRRVTAAASVQHGLSGNSGGGPSAANRIQSLHIVDSMTFASSRTHVFTATKPVQCLVLDEFAATVACMSKDQSSLVSVLPTLRPLGVGVVTCLAASTVGHLVLLGTSRGIIVTLERPHATVRYALSQVLRTSSVREGRIRAIQTWPDGLVAATADGLPGVHLWHMAADGVRFCRTVQLADGDATPVRAVARHDDAAHLLVVCKERSLYVVSASSGATLLAVPLPSADVTNLSLSELPVGAAARGTALDNLQCAAFVQGPYARSLILVCGHRDGTLSCWSITALPDPTSFAVPYGAELVGTVATHSSSGGEGSGGGGPPKASPITALLPLLDAKAVCVATQAGSVFTMALPMSQQQSQQMANDVFQTESYA